jgi:hypothetical protein
MANLPRPAGEAGSARTLAGAEPPAARAAGVGAATVPPGEEGLREQAVPDRGGAKLLEVEAHVRHHLTDGRPPWCCAPVKTPVTECTPGAVVGGVRHGDAAGPPLPRSPARLRPLGRHGGRASLRSRRGPQARDDRASRGVDRPRRARCDAACRRTRGTAVRAWAAGAGENGRRRAGQAARTAAGLCASEHQAFERTRGCNRARPTSSIPLGWASCRSTSGTTCWARGRPSCSRCCGPRRAPRSTVSAQCSSSDGPRCEELRSFHMVLRP